MGDEDEDEDEGEDDYEVVQEGSHRPTLSGYETDVEVDDEVGFFAVSTDRNQTNKWKQKLTSSRLDRLERSTAKAKDFYGLVPKAVIVEAHIGIGDSGNHRVCALVDTGSLADFMSSRIVDQLGLTLESREKPMSCQLAVSGSRTVVNHCVVIEIMFQDVREKRRFDMINLDSYDLILGTPCMFRHKMSLGVNLSKVAVGPTEALPIEGSR